MKVCSNCKSDKVQIKQWIFANTGKLAGGDIEQEYKQDQWCPECEENVLFETIEDDITGS